MSRDPDMADALQCAPRYGAIACEKPDCESLTSRGTRVIPRQRVD